MTMRRAKNSIRSPRSDEDLARMVVSVAKATQVDGIMLNPWKQDRRRKPHNMRGILTLPICLMSAFSP